MCRSSSSMAGLEPIISVSFDSIGPLIAPSSGATQHGNRRPSGDDFSPVDCLWECCRRLVRGQHSHKQSTGEKSSPDGRRLPCCVAPDDGAMSGPIESKLTEMIGSSPAMLELERHIAGAARCHAKVLVTGETGSGKEMVTRLIHQRGPRASAPMMTLNCAGLPDALLESELFGHVRGSFTGA